MFVIFVSALKQMMVLFLFMAMGYYMAKKVEKIWARCFPRWKCTYLCLAMPMGLNSIIVPESYGSDVTYASQATFVSNIL